MGDLSRRAFGRTLLAAGISLPFVDLTGARDRRFDSSRPNVLFFLSDDLGYGDLGCYGNPIIQTPHLDRLAGQGCRFTDAHSASPICSPARAALLTGRQPYRLGIYYLLESGVHLQRQEVTIAALLKSRGYDTCFVGKWHVSTLGEHANGQPSPGDFGFDHWFATEHNAFEGPHHPRDFIRNGERVGPVEGWYCDAIVREALDWLAHRADPRRPFYIHACSHEPHTPIDPPTEDSAKYAALDVARLEASVPYGGVERRPNPNQDGRYYYGTVTQLDRAVGGLLDGVDAHRPSAETIVFFTSDNGPEYPVNWTESHDEWEDPLRDRSFGTPGPLRGMKRYTYEGGHRVPLIVRWPGRVTPGAVSAEFINGTDYLPTIAGLAGIPVPADRTIDGASLIPMFEGRPVVRPIPALWTFPVDYTFFPSMTMRVGDYALAAWLPEKPRDRLWIDHIKTAQPDRFELYDLRTDIGERRDLSDADPARLREMTSRLQPLWRGIQADAPVWPDWKRR
jgi:arylsulfatase A